MRKLRFQITEAGFDRRSYGRTASVTIVDATTTILALIADTDAEPIKINMVVMAGVNDLQIDPMLAYCIDRGFTLRLIETMPMGYTGRGASHMNLLPVKNRVQREFGLINSVMTGGGPARYLADRDGKFHVGFITPLSQHFCASCNRVRLSMDGTLLLCLGQEDHFEFRGLLRSGASDERLRSAILEAVCLKPERHDFGQGPAKIVRFMSSTGG